MKIPVFSFGSTVMERDSKFSRDDLYIEPIVIGSSTLRTISGLLLKLWLSNLLEKRISFAKIELAFDARFIGETSISIFGLLPFSLLPVQYFDLL